MLGLVKAYLHPLPCLFRANRIKRLTQAKKQKERERKELEQMNRKHLANMRVVQKNLVYVVGLNSKLAKEEVRGSHSRRIVLLEMNAMLMIRFFLVAPFTAHSNSAKFGVLWAVWSHIQNSHLQTHLSISPRHGHTRYIHRRLCDLRS